MKITNLLKKDFETILKSYDIGQYKKSKHITWALGNTVYIINTSKGKFILKIFENIQDLDYIRYQIRIINFLSKKGLPISNIIKANKGFFLLVYKNKKILIQKFIDGKIPKKLSYKLINDMANKIGLMDKNLIKLKLTGKFIWEEDHEFKPLYCKTVEIKDFNFEEEVNRLLKKLRKLKREKLRKSVVHGDCHSVNLLIRDDKLKAIIDWDDVHEDYLIYEISTFIMHSFFMTPSFFKKGIFNKKQIKLFLKQYQKYIKLNSEEKKAVYYFVKQRFLQVIEWQSIQMKAHKDLVKKLKRDQFRQIEQYKTLSKISLEEFMELFEK